MGAAAEGDRLSGARKTLLIAAALFLGNVAINAPLFLPGEHKYRDSIEGGYASMARFLSEHPNPFGWNPLQYKGLPTHDWYLPVLPYTAAAAINVLPFLKAEHVYRLVVVTCLCLGPVTMFLFVLEFVRSRRWALAAALFYTFLSVSYSLFPAVKADQGFTYVPWRVQVLVKYGEGPHNVGLMLLPLALMACWRAACGRRFRQIALAGAALAAVTLTNWVAAVALAWCCLMMLLAGAMSASETGFLGRRILMASALGYAFAAFWLTPRFIGTTFFNWPTDAFGYKADDHKYWLGAALFLFPLLIAAGIRWRPRLYYFGYLLLCLSGFAWVVSLHYLWKIDVIPESRRYAIEVEFFCIAAATEALRYSLTSRHRAWRDAGLVVLGFALSQGHVAAWTYLSRTWIMLRPAPRSSAIEYQVAERLAAMKPRGRVFVFGGTRFRLNSWFPLAQVGGTFESGLRNRGSLPLLYHIQKGPERPVEERASDALNMLRAAGVEYAAFHGPRSREHWRDVMNPDLVASRLEPVWREGDDAIYRVPYGGLANFIQAGEIPFGRPVGKFAGYIAPYVRAMDNADRPRIEVAWEGNNRILLRTPEVRDGYLITLRVSHDAGWHAVQDGQPVALRADPMGNLLIEPRMSENPAVIRLDFRPPLQQMAGTAVSLIAIVAAAFAIRRERRQLRDLP